MQTLPTPQVVERTEQPYVGITRTVTMTTMGEIADRIPVLIGRLAELGTAPAGAPFLRGGKPLGGQGYYDPPSVLTDIPENAPAYREELFGPVAMIFRARDVDDAIRIANDSPFGLGGSAWTQDAAEQERFVNEVETGMMYINKFTRVDGRGALRRG
ncbi:MAG: aldehyde dehydrogenase family protein [Pseudonocardia sp.]|nr:aldehyde dehydrogenase family protein [Pseudonocardia sp.]